MRAFLISSPLKIVAAAGVLALAATACSDANPAPADPAPADDGPVVVVTDLAYHPATLTVPVGTTVTWVFDDGAIAHDVSSDGFRSELMASGTFSHTFDQPGTYEYLCTIHPSMTGTIDVTP